MTAKITTATPALADVVDAIQLLHRALGHVHPQ